MRVVARDRDRLPAAEVALPDWIAGGNPAALARDAGWSADRTANGTWKVRLAEA